MASPTALFVPTKAMLKQLIVFYASGTGFSGQRLATEIVIEGLENKGWQVEAVPTPALDRVGSNSKLGYLTLSANLFLVWLKGLTVAFSRTLIYVNLAQTKYGMIRDGFPLLARSVLPLKSRAVLSLHGSLFLEWQANSLEARLFKQMSRAANVITVLGPSQKNKLIDLGVAREKIVCLDNTCLLAPVTEKMVQQHQNQYSLQVLYLSSLIETKGYVEFVEAIRLLAQSSCIPIEAILCGKITANSIQEHSKFENYTAAKLWLEDKIKQVNNSVSVRLSWIDGATGKKKENLFRDAQIFVLPSRYKVEAQPIAILEALASGCAIVATISRRDPDDG